MIPSISVQKILRVTPRDSKLDHVYILDVSVVTKAGMFKIGDLGIYIVPEVFLEEDNNNLLTPRGVSTTGALLPMSTLDILRADFSVTPYPDMDLSEVFSIKG